MIDLTSFFYGAAAATVLIFCLVIIRTLRVKMECDSIMKRVTEKPKRFERAIEEFKR